MSYPELRNVVGPNVPDLRGLFLRGVGGNSAALGIQQKDAVGKHRHAEAIGSPNRTADCCGGIASTKNVTTSDEEYCKTIEGQMSWRCGGYYGENETRPVNMAVRYLIRARP